MLLCGQDFAEAIAQIAMYPPGRDALLQDPAVSEALHQVAAEGWEEEARQHAQAALAALSDRQQADWHPDPDHKHLMLSYQWDVQETIQRIVNELQARGFCTWFDLVGSTFEFIRLRLLRDDGCSLAKKHALRKI